MVWYSHLFRNFPQFIVIHTVKGFGKVNKAEIDVFLELSCFFDDPVDVGNLISGSSAFSKTSLSIWKGTQKTRDHRLWNLINNFKSQCHSFLTLSSWTSHLSSSLKQTDNIQCCRDVECVCGTVSGNPLHYPCLGNPMDRGAWWIIVHWFAKELDTT